MNAALLKTELIGDEGLRLKLYPDTRGIPTLGVGRNVQDVGISTDEAMYLLVNDINRVTSELTKELPWWITRPEPVQRAMANMCFQLGLAGLLGFGKTLACLQAGDFEGARTHALDSAWAKQTPERAKRVTDMFVEP